MTIENAFMELREAGMEKGGHGVFYRFLLKRNLVRAGLAADEPGAKQREMEAGLGAQPSAGRIHRRPSREMEALERIRFASGSDSVVREETSPGRQLQTISDKVRGNVTR